KHQKNGLAPLEERKRLCDPPNLPNLISFICLFPINMQPLALFLRKEPGGLSSISLPPLKGGVFLRQRLLIQQILRLTKASLDALFQLLDKKQRIHLIYRLFRLQIAL
ncbi:hypothetical protein, partial [Planifilum fimeticola]|uniref:hypothetical protein n=1 Tax=Planifilum fimeticola TaxID=201975 RepID=UPI001B804D59